MRHLNYTHLLYFWTVAREGTITRASEVLHLTPQTISGQLKLLDEAVGEPLFSRVGRGLVLTETGQVVKQYADEIFMLGAELTQRVKSKQALIHTTFNVGIVSSIPKLVALRILKPALEMDEPLRIVCREGELENMLGELALHRLDLLISDRPIPAGTSVKAYNYPLGDSGINLFAHESIADRYRRSFPESLEDAPMLLPALDSPLRSNLEDWFDTIRVRPRVLAEFDDSALLKAFGNAALGVFPAPACITEEVVSMYHSRMVGRVESIRESYFAISPERKLKHPAVVQITDNAREALFE
jgi:LysR family transcriptional activator of nhaA